MKICPNCQQEMDDSFTTCENCGADLVDMVGEEEMQRPLRRTPSALGPRTPGSMARPVHPRSTPSRASLAARRSTPAGVNARRKAEEEERELNEQRSEDMNHAASFTPGFKPAESDAQSSMTEEAAHFAPDTSESLSETTLGASHEASSSTGHIAPTMQERLMKRNHPEWDLDTSSEESEDHFKPIPPFVTAEEADRPSPFVPAKNPVTSDSTPNVPRGRASVDVAANPEKRIDTSSGSGEISVTVRICPSCRSRCFSSEKTCKNCGYQFPKAGALASLSAKSTNILAMLAALAMAISVFTNIMTYKVNGVKEELKLIDSYHGFGFLALAALAMVFAFSGKNIAVIIVGLLSAIAAAAELYYRWYDITKVNKYSNVDNEIGIWLLGAGAGLIFVAGIYGMIKEKKKMEQFTTDYLNSI